MQSSGRRESEGGCDRPKPRPHDEAYQQFEAVFEWALNQAEQSGMGLDHLDAARDELRQADASVVETPDL
ncbi:MAG: hypothetical protein ACXVVQ_22790 [Solirubrobacteraceae bacterium]